MKEIFVEREKNDIFRVTNSINACKPRTTAYGLEAISFLGDNMWQSLPLHTTKSQSLKHLKVDIRVWSFTCNCRLSMLQIKVLFRYIYVLRFVPFFLLVISIPPFSVELVDNIVSKWFALISLELLGSLKKNLLSLLLLFLLYAFLDSFMQLNIFDISYQVQ